MKKKAIHFGVDTAVGDIEPVFFDSIKDAGYYHLLSNEKGFESCVQTSDLTPISNATIKEQLKQLSVDGGSEPGVYFISLTAHSTLGRRRFRISSKPTFNKHLTLHNDNVFGWHDLTECLSYFSKNDHVFFLITDLKRGKRGQVPSFVSRFKPSHKVQAKAVVLSLSLDRTLDDGALPLSLTSDINVVLNSAKTIGDLVSNLDALYGEKSKVRPAVFHFNLAEENRFFLNN
ncbi:MAG: hypothetical protein JJ975_10900 [Bacteroidia bacterium]|nr:hypothetical protein [Bacteroidia bacterium]